MEASSQVGAVTAELKRTKIMLSASALILTLKVSPSPAKNGVHAPAKPSPHTHAAILAPASDHIFGTRFNVSTITGLM